MCYYYRHRVWRTVWRGVNVARYNPQKDPYRNGTYILITLIICAIAVLVVVARCSTGH